MKVLRSRGRCKLTFASPGEKVQSNRSVRTLWIALTHHKRLRSSCLGNKDLLGLVRNTSSVACKVVRREEFEVCDTLAGLGPLSDSDFGRSRLHCQRQSENGHNGSNVKHFEIFSWSVEVERTSWVENFLGLNECWKLSSLGGSPEHLI
jgi:hypothetical protein